jgi:hypothetical protein
MSTDGTKSPKKTRSQLRNSKGKEVNTVNYAKPAITLIDAAKSAIQGIPKSALPGDSTPGEKIGTVNAYEADE